MNRIKLLFSSSLGKKLIMAASGLGLTLFAVGHMVGNLQIFLPPEAINRYAHFLQSNRELLWLVRLGLLALVGLHLWSALQLSAENRAARGVAYARDPAPGTSSFASRTMLVSGFIVAAFLVYHLLHFTVRLESVHGGEVVFADLKDPLTGHADVYAIMVAGFQVWYVSLFYIIGVGLLALHLSHGMSAMFQSLGLMNRSYRVALARGARIVALLLFLGYASIPFSVLVLGLGHGHLKEAVARGAEVAVNPEPAK